jgi:hypothetical protein
MYQSGTAEQAIMLVWRDFGDGYFGGREGLGGREWIEELGGFYEFKWVASWMCYRKFSCSVPMGWVRK